MCDISKTAVEFRSQTEFGNVVANFPGLQVHPICLEKELNFMYDSQGGTIFFDNATASKCVNIFTVYNKFVIFFTMTF